MLFAAAAALSPGDAFPELKTQSLTGHAVSLPADVKGKVAFLAMAWAKRFLQDFKDERRATYYSLPMIGGMGRMAKPFIEGGMRKTMTPAEQDHIAPVYSSTDPWKKRVGFQGGDDADVVVLDAGGAVRFVCSGKLEEGQYGKAAEAVRALLQ